MWSKIKQLLVDVFFTPDVDDQLDSELSSNLVIEIESIVNLKTGKELTGEIGGHRQKQGVDQIKIGNRWYNEDDIAITTKAVADSEKWTG